MQTQNNFFNMMSMFMNNGNNPQMFLQNQLMQNPQLAQMKRNIETMMTGSNMSGRDFTVQWCKQNGIAEEQVLQVAKMFGLQ